MSKWWFKVDFFFLLFVTIGATTYGCNDVWEQTIRVTTTITGNCGCLSVSPYEEALSSLGVSWVRAGPRLTPRCGRGGHARSLACADERACVVRCLSAVAGPYSFPLPGLLAPGFTLLSPAHRSPVLPGDHAYRCWRATTPTSSW